MDRFYGAVAEFGADPIVRITADCPLIDPQVIDKLVNAYLEGECDYVTNTLRYTYPDGMDVEVFSFGILETAWKEATLPCDREHVTPYMRSSGRYRLLNVENERELPQQYRWTVDEEADLEFARAVYSGLWSNEDCFGMDEILLYLDRNPDIAETNRIVIRNAGYYKSLAKEPPMAPGRPTLEAFERAGSKGGANYPLRHANLQQRAYPVRARSGASVLGAWPGQSCVGCRRQ